MPGRPRPAHALIVAAALGCSRAPPPLALVDERAFAPPAPGLIFEDTAAYDGATLLAQLVDPGTHTLHVYRFDAAGVAQPVGEPFSQAYQFWYPQMVAVAGATTAVGRREPARVLIDDRPLFAEMSGAPRALLLADGLLFVGGGNQVRVLRTNGVLLATLHPPEEVKDIAFGEALAYAQGVLVVGEPPATWPRSGAESGRAHVYRKDGDGFRLLATLTPQADELARAVATDGTWIAVGDAYARTDLGLGKVLVYRVAGDAVTLDATLSSAEPGNRAIFGADVSLDGGRLAVAARGTSSDPRKRPGAVHVFERCGDRWVEALVRRGSGDADRGFARRVWVRGDRLLVVSRDGALAGRLSGGCAGR